MLQASKYITILTRELTRRARGNNIGRLFNVESIEFVVLPSSFLPLITQAEALISLSI